MNPAADAWSLFKPGDRVALHGAGGEPRGALAALEADPELGRGLDFKGIWLPGVNDIDPSAIAPESTAEVIFITPALRDGFLSGRVKLQPINYWASEQWIARHARLDGAILQVSPPQDGFVTAGIACDFDQALLRGAKVVVGEVNSAMPVPPTAPRIPVERFAMLTEAGTELPTYSAGALPEDLQAVAALIAGLIRPGDTVQVGIGKAAAAVMEALRDHRGLNYHAGLIIEEFAPLLETGVFSGGSITTGTVIGSPDLYARVAEDPRIVFKGVDFTHDLKVIGAIPDFRSVNSALSVDLFGQATQEMLGGRQISGQGGAGDFARGARMSEGGMGILALPATARRGTESRITLRLHPDMVSLPRADASVVVTEYGVADLRWLDIDARAAALIEVAAPQFRDGLANEWDALRRTM